MSATQPFSGWDRIDPPPTGLGHQGENTLTLMIVDRRGALVASAGRVLVLPSEVTGRMVERKTGLLPVEHLRIHSHPKEEHHDQHHRLEHPAAARHLRLRRLAGGRPPR